MNISIKSHVLNKENLKKFGRGLGVILLIVFGIINPFIFKKEPIFWIIGIGGIFIILAYLYPYAFKPLFILFSEIARIIGPINQCLLLSIIFYFILFPIHLMLWIFRYDPMHRHFNKKLNSYRIVNTREINIEEPF